MHLKKVTTLRPKGWVHVSDPDGTVEHDTGCCVHCGAHWVVSEVARLRPWCSRHGGPCCEKPGCLPSDTCVAAEEALDIYEKVSNAWRPPAPSETTPRIIVP